MWLQAKSPIKLLSDAKGAKPRIVGEADPAFEVDDDTGAELVKLGAAIEVAERVAASAAASTKAAK